MKIQIVVDPDELTDDEKRAFVFFCKLYRKPNENQESIISYVKAWAEQFRSDWAHILRSTHGWDKGLENAMHYWPGRVVYGVKKGDNSWHDRLIESYGQLPSFYEFLQDEGLWVVRNVGDKRKEMLRQIREQLTTMENRL